MKRFVRKVDGWNVVDFAQECATQAKSYAAHYAAESAAYAVGPPDCWCRCHDTQGSRKQ